MPSAPVSSTELSSARRPRGCLIPSVLALAMALAGCQATVAVQPSRGEPIRLPEQLRRLAVLYPASSDHVERQAYRRLEAEAFGLKAHRPRLTIVDRQHLPVLRRELEFQLRGFVDDETAVRVGHVLGVDAVLLYLIDGPSLRDIVLARYSGGLSPIVVTAKLIAVESGEVVYHSVVVSPVTGGVDGGRKEVRASLDRAIARTVHDLRDAFR